MAEENPIWGDTRIQRALPGRVRRHARLGGLLNYDERANAQLLRRAEL
jgi:hypothetical protein